MENKMDELLKDPEVIVRLMDSQSVLLILWENFLYDKSESITRLRLNKLSVFWNVFFS